MLNQPILHCLIHPLDLPADPGHAQKIMGQPRLHDQGHLAAGILQRIRVGNAFIMQRVILSDIDIGRGQRRKAAQQR
ncbi:hypothetical protein D3C76_1703440 [compost metagenome]